MGAPRVVHEPGELRRACDAARRAGSRVGLIPTMGALHEGHLSLVREAARRDAGFLAVTIFVNPLQFGPGEDLERYPRTLETDVERCGDLGVDLVFAPPAGAMYPDGFSTGVRVDGLTARWEGKHRPGHFDGVTTVVAKLLNLAGPCLAVFGRKDYQQWKVIARMARDLDMPVEVVDHPTVREADGLALSSRNRYLSPPERERALGIVRGLRAAHQAYDRGERQAHTLLEAARAPVAEAFDRIDYVALADPETLEPVDGTVTAGPWIGVAAHIGGTRLIDNTVLGGDCP